MIGVGEMHTYVLDPHSKPVKIKADVELIVNGEIKPMAHTGSVGELFDRMNSETGIKATPLDCMPNGSGAVVKAMYEGRILESKGSGSTMVECYVRGYGDILNQSRNSNI